VVRGETFAVASRLRQAHLCAAPLTGIEASTLAHLLVRHLSVGFSNLSQFRRLFRRRNGLTPAGLRRIDSYQSI
jgi:hypothetical protein